MDDNAYFCPECGSPSVDFSELIGGTASCRACSWKGSKMDLAVAPIKHDFMSQEQMVRELFNDVRKALGENSIPIARMLVKWGFVDPNSPHLKMQLGAYITWGAQAFLESMVKTREKLQAPQAEPAVGKPIPEDPDGGKYGSGQQPA